MSPRLCPVCSATSDIQFCTAFKTTAAIQKGLDGAARGIGKRFKRLEQPINHDEPEGVES